MDKEASSDVCSSVQMELEDISSKIADLDKWRKIFNVRGLEITHRTFQKYQDCKSDNDKDASGTCQNINPTEQSRFPFNTLYSIPKAVIISSDLGGHPISLEMALELRRMLFGNTFEVFNYEWKRSYFRFHCPFTDLAYALEMDKVGATAIQMAVQVHIMKYFLFVKNKEENISLQRWHSVLNLRSAFATELPSRITPASIQFKCMLICCHISIQWRDIKEQFPLISEISLKEQEKTLTRAVADILWTAGESQRATICLITDDTYFTANIDYEVDHFTEQVQLFDFFEKETMQQFILDHIHCLNSEGSHGVILFLYSLLFSRTFERLQGDLDFTTTHLLQWRHGDISCRQAILNLILTGRASPHVFNGCQKLDTEGSMQKVQHGILSRSDVGYLRWSKEETEQYRSLQVGSMLKTPKLPIWLCNINETYSILFSLNRLLLSDWKMEHLFDLYFYKGKPSQKKTVHLTIDTHSHHWEENHSVDDRDPNKRVPSLDMAIRTKWEGAAISWNGTTPFF